MAEIFTRKTEPDEMKNLNVIHKLFGHGDPENDMDKIYGFFIPFLSVAILAAGWVGWTANATGPVLLWVFASLAAGGTTGFLFGIPKSGMSSKVDSFSPVSKSLSGSLNHPETDVSPRARPNTNLEEVSDWLTKILVGLTLANLTELKREIGRISLNAAAAIRPHPNEADISAATALVVGFALVGFLGVYLYMRLFVQGAMVRSDDQLHQYRSALERAERIDQEESRMPAIASDDSAVAVVPSPASMSAAQEVANAAPPNRPELVLKPLRELAAEYEALRQVQGYSLNRTRQMTEIVSRMRKFAIAAAPYISDLINSTSTGDHLAATVILQMRYMPEHMEWLARRLVEERAFIGYQAASALLARVKLAGVPECKELQSAVQKAKEERLSKNIMEGSLDKLIDQILEAR